MAANKKKRMGRPPVPKERRRSAQHSVSMTQSEFAFLKRKAKESGLSISELLLQPWRREMSE